MSDYVSRLRESKRKWEEVSYKAGYEAGQGWAKESAEAEELDRLDTSMPSDPDELRKRLSECTPEFNHPAMEVYQAIRPDWGGEVSEFEAFWKKEVGCNLKSNAAFAQGFVEGALAIWHEVQDQL